MGKTDDIVLYPDDEKVLVGSMERVTGKYMRTDGLLPDWLERGVESSLRDSEDDMQPAPVVPTALSSAGPMRNKAGVATPPIVLTPTGLSRPSSAEGTKGKWRDLDTFYAEDEEEADEETEEEEEDGSEEEEDGSEAESGSGSEDDDENDVTHKS